MPTKHDPEGSEDAWWAECIRNRGNTMVYITGDIHGDTTPVHDLFDKY